MSERGPVADFSISPLSDLRATSWWKPRRVAVLGEAGHEDRLLTEFLAQLLAAFREQGHLIVDSHAEDVHLMLAVGQVPVEVKDLAVQTKVVSAVADARGAELRRFQVQVIAGTSERPDAVAVLVEPV